MIIQNLIENTQGHNHCAYAHGLSFYIETKKHNLLVDLGPSSLTLENAKELNIDLKKVDTVILSHGHYDHSGGIMPFVKINNEALIYMQALADANYYADDGVEAGEARYRYIGIDPEISKLDNVKKISGDFKIDDELELFTIKMRSHALPFTNRRLLVKKAIKLTKDTSGPKREDYVRDDFRHEHFLLIRSEGKTILVSGCAHNGILSIMDAYKDKYGAEPDYVISGFHLKKKTEYSKEEEEEIRAIARELKAYKTKFYTCHCTGIPAFELMKEIMGESLEYVHSGDKLNIN